MAVIAKKNRVSLVNLAVRTVHFWFPPVIWAIFIFSFSSVTTPKVSELHWQDFIIKKMAHVVEYGFFAILLFRAFKGSGFDSKRAFAYSLFVSIVYGITDEFHQSFTPSREPTVRDAIIDSAGSLGALLSVRDILPKTPGKVRNFMLKLDIEYK